MDTQHESGQNQQQSGELHLDKIANTGTQQVAPPPASFEPASPSGKGTTNADQTVFYVQDDTLLEEPDDAFGSVLAAPFQMSEAMPPVHSATGQASQQNISPTPATSPQASRPFPLRRVLILVAIIVIIVLTGAMGVFAQSTPTLPGKTASPTASAAPTRPAQATPQPGTGKTPTAPPQPTPKPGPGNTSQNGAGTWLPQQLPAGWTDAGLTTGDALFAERTAVVFTDREMSLDYRSVGTRKLHGGTFTASVFLLTPAAKERFARNDVRVINNVLFDKIQQEKRIQSVVNPQPQLVKFAVQGQQQFAWLDVSFQLWQSKADAGGKRTESFDLDPTTKQPRIHHMAVLLLRVDPDDQGANAPMGGTGWLVSTYALDQNAGTMLPILQPA